MRVTKNAINTSRKVNTDRQVQMWILLLLLHVSGNASTHAKQEESHGHIAICLSQDISCMGTT